MIQACLSASCCQKGPLVVAHPKSNHEPQSNHEPDPIECVSKPCPSPNLTSVFPSPGSACYADQQQRKWKRARRQWKKTHHGREWENRITGPRSTASLQHLQRASLARSLAVRAHVFVSSRSWEGVSCACVRTQESEGWRAPCLAVGLASRRLLSGSQGMF